MRFAPPALRLYMMVTNDGGRIRQLECGNESPARAIFPRARFLHVLAGLHLDVATQPGGWALMTSIA
jgi:hypothetical protein